MPGIPLAALAFIAPGHWKAIFGKDGGREVKLMLGFALLNIVVSMSIGAIVHALVESLPTPRHHNWAVSTRRGVSPSSPRPSRNCWARK